MRRAVAAALGFVLLAACAGSGSRTADGSGAARTETITLITHSSFQLSENVLKGFTDRTGITVNVAKGGDAGAVVNQAILTKGSPTGDVLYGIDDANLARALDAGIFAPYESPALGALDPRLVLDPQHRVTPVDESDVCVNYDKRAFGGPGQPAPPSTLEDLTKPEYARQLVVEDAASSSTGLAFLLATVARYGDPGFVDYWRKLKDGGVTVVDDWDKAYNGAFSAGGGGSGDKAIVVSYATSPPADIVYASPAKSTTDVGVLTDGCYRQVELAGVLAGTQHEAAARQLVDFLVSEEVQADIPLNMFVYPARVGTPLPDVFTANVVKPATTLSVPTADISAKRDGWQRAWAAAVGA